MNVLVVHYIAYPNIFICVNFVSYSFQWRAPHCADEAVCAGADVVDDALALGLGFALAVVLTLVTSLLLELTSVGVIVRVSTQIAHTRTLSKFTGYSAL